MQAFTVESKTALAKLMATENLSIEHQKMSERENKNEENKLLIKLV